MRFVTAERQSGMVLEASFERALSCPAESNAAIEK
jgi:hypothetical protein